MEKKKLTARQERFIAEYRFDRNARAAALRAGFSESGVRTAAKRLMENPEIARRIAEDSKEAANAFIDAVDAAHIDVDATLRE